MVPPRKGSHNARRYRGHLDVRVPQKRNNVHISHPDSHYCRAQMAYMLEFGQKFSRSVATLSCDNKIKVNVGTLAVSRYHQLKHFFPVDDAPNYNDNNFPWANAKIVPSGYLLLEHKPRRLRPQH